MNTKTVLTVIIGSILFALFVYCAIAPYADGATVNFIIPTVTPIP